ncbi:hypothetical protein SADUNF_Sadunf15G0092800 [Salix dunnii]|uniref:Uncharacterized protein n=1 Tax=Salix dunnii TaxID=1413687 RepID=A0A835JGT6_9ROSI|nr:hypothetical protein SADUNF_Sadunf15G0092800 [Salix dunnii]
MAVRSVTKLRTDVSLLSSRYGLLWSDKLWKCEVDCMVEDGELRDREMDLRAQIAAIVEKGKEMSKAETEAGDAGPTVTESDIQHIVSSWTGIPVEKVSTDESDRLLKMEDTLHKRVIGQDEAVKAIRRARVGRKNPN